MLETVVRLNGGVPATIGVLNGVARIGLSPDELIELASTAEKGNALKVSRRDLGCICGMVLALLNISEQVLSELGNDRKTSPRRHNRVGHDDSRPFGRN